MLPLSVVSHETPCDSCGEHLWAAGVNNVLIKKVYLSTTMSFVFYTYFIILSTMIMIVIIELIIIIIIIIIIITIIFHKTVYEFMLISFFYLAKIAYGNGVM